jgi:hypothetical protein
MPNFTNDGQTDLDEVANVITGGITNDNQVEAERNKEAQVASPNATGLVPTTSKDPFGKLNSISSSIGAGVPDTREKLTTFYEPDNQYTEQNAPYFTNKGFVDFVKSRKSLDFVERANILQDKNGIDFNIKKSNSANGINVNFGVDLNAVGLITQSMNNAGRFDALKNSIPENRELLTEYFSSISNVNLLKSKNVTENDPQYQDAIANFKILLGQVINADKELIRSTGQWQKYSNLSNSYDEYNNKLNKLIYVYNQDGDSLKSNYDTLINNDNRMVTEKIYYDLDTANDIKYQATGSRMSKDKLLKNPIWQEQMKAMISSNETFGILLAKESNKNYVSDFERKIIKNLAEKVGPQIHDKYTEAVNILGQAEATKQFGSTMELFDIYNNLTQKTVIDDIINQAYQPTSSFNIMLTEQNLYDRNVDNSIEGMTEKIRSSAELKAYEAKAKAKKQINTEVWGDFNNNTTTTSKSSEDELAAYRANAEAKNRINEEVYGFNKPKQSKVGGAYRSLINKGVNI